MAVNNWLEPVQGLRPPTAMERRPVGKTSSPSDEHHDTPSGERPVHWRPRNVRLPPTTLQSALHQLRSLLQAIYAFVGLLYAGLAGALSEHYWV